MAFFSQDFLERVRSANELTQVVAGYNVHLKRAGANMLGLCPFHNEKTPSFNVKTAEQFFRCFGCGAKGDVFRFVQMMEKVEFPEAIRLLAERAGLPLEYDSPTAARDAARQGQTKSALLWCCSRALDYFEERLNTPQGNGAREYLLSRGFEPETIARWRLGWAPDSWDGLSGFLLKNAKDLEQKEKVLEYAVQAGVLRVREDDRGGKKRYYDAFRGRVMFPIMDTQSRPVAFGGRVLEEKPEAGGKYINSSEGRLFEKRKVLFGLSHAAKEIALSGAAVVVEGYTDVIMCHQDGIRNVIATLGTALTEDHIALLRRQVAGKGRVTAFFDSDAAGEKATLRAIALFMGQDVPLSVAGDLELKDACDFLPKFGAEEFKKKLALAEDSFTYMVNRTLGRARGRDLAAMGLAVREVMQLVNMCPDPVQRALMRKRVAAEAGIPEETLPQAEIRTPTAPGRVAAANQARPSSKPGLLPPAPRRQEVEDALQRGEDALKRREARLLRYMWENREWCARVADSYPPDEWRDPALAELAALARDDWDIGRSPSINDARARVDDPGAADRLADLAFPDDEPLSEKELSRLLSLMLDENRREEIRLLLAEMEKAQKAGDADLEVRLLTEYTRLQALRKKVH